MNILILTIIVLFSLSSYYFGRSEARKLITTNKIKLNALPSYYGYYLAVWCGLPALIILSLWSLFEPTIIKILIINNTMSCKMTCSAGQSMLARKSITFPFRPQRGRSI